MGDTVAHWEMVVRHDQPDHGVPLETCGRLIVAGNVRLTQPARTVIGGLAVLGQLQQVVCIGCGRELRIVSCELKDNGLRITRAD